LPWRRFKRCLAPLHGFTAAGIVQLWGLTGGIASGKTTVAELFAALGAQVLNADATYHTLLAPVGGSPSPLAQRLVDAFADLPILRADGSIDRQVLGAQVFAHPALRARLEAIAHPAVAAATAAAVEQLRQRNVAHVLYDVPLLFEKNLQANFAGVVVAWVPRALQLQRLQARDALSAEAATTRLAAQLSLDEKKEMARWVVDNSGSRAHSAAQVETIWGDMQAAAKH
jgi:dephospho-CoA kinase